jgi:hypothetical protein
LGLTRRTCRNVEQVSNLFQNVEQVFNLFLDMPQVENLRYSRRLKTYATAAG